MISFGDHYTIIVIMGHDVKECIKLLFINFVGQFKFD